MKKIGKILCVVAMVVLISAQIKGISFIIGSVSDKNDGDNIHVSNIPEELESEVNDIVAEENKIPTIDWENVPTIDENMSDQDVETSTEGTEKPTSKPAYTVDVNEFNNCYAYSTLNEDDKLLYNEMYTACINFEKSVLLTTTDLDRLEHVYYAIDADHSEIYWISGYSYIYYTYGEEILNIEFKPTYTLTQEQRDFYQTQIDDVVDMFLAKASMNMTDYEKSKYVYEMLINNVDYDISAPNNQNIISVFLGGRTVCKGYAAAAQYLLRELNVPSIIVSGGTGNESHAWNLVKLDGEWYHFDATWGNSKYQPLNDTVEKYVDYAYLNITDSEVYRTHVIHDYFTLPACQAVTDNYFVKENRYVDVYDESFIGSIIESAWVGGRSMCNLKFSNSDIYVETVRRFLVDKEIGEYCHGLRTYTYVENQENNIVTIYLIRK